MTHVIAGSPASATARSLAGGIAVYLHIPFCQTKCPYCDFNTYAGISHLIPPYLEAITTEVLLWGQTLGHPPVTSIFLGGGTPSLMEPQQMQTLLASVHQSFPVLEDAEITAEVNPDDVTVKRLQSFRDSGVTRISIGVQSLDPALLRLLGRRHSAAQAVEAYRRVRQAGFTNVSMDLMYGLPHQELTQWQATLNTILELAPEHLSAYCLTLEGGTPMEHQVSTGTLPEPDPDLAAEMYEWADMELTSRGYQGYEISNWALPGFPSRHNLTYWHNIPYLGVGPGAHSYLAGYRFSILTSPVEYIQQVSLWRQQLPGHSANLDASSLQAVPSVATIETIDLPLEMAETLMMRLRLAEGMELADFQQRFGIDLFEVYGGVVEEVVALELAELVGGKKSQRLRLTPRGRLLGNQVFSRLMLPPHPTPDPIDRKPGSS